MAVLLYDGSATIIALSSLGWNGGRLTIREARGGGRHFAPFLFRLYIKNRAR